MLIFGAANHDELVAQAAIPFARSPLNSATAEARAQLALEQGRLPRSAGASPMDTLTNQFTARVYDLREQRRFDDANALEAKNVTCADMLF